MLSKIELAQRWLTLINHFGIAEINYHLNKGTKISTIRIRLEKLLEENPNVRPLQNP